jgi:hypothetical protein
LQCLIESAMAAKGTVVSDEIVYPAKIEFGIV